jgi:sorting nexin-4
MAREMDPDDFHDVYDTRRPAAQKAPEVDDAKQVNEAPAAAGPQADAMDLAGLDGGTLECAVGQPIKENDGTKDAYVSYLVTTKVCFCLRPQGDSFS